VAEQIASADLGRMGAVVLLGLSSDDVTGAPGSSNRGALLESLGSLMAICGASTLHTHEPTDAHRTHRAVATAVVSAVRASSASVRPRQLLGWEGWRSLDWLDDASRHVADLTGRLADAAALAGCHASQLAAKRYDDATCGRWRANATFSAPRSADAAEALALAWDLTELLNPEVDPTAFVEAATARFTATASDGAATWW
jgi:hypothetical protein